MASSWSFTEYVGRKASHFLLLISFGGWQGCQSVICVGHWIGGSWDRTSNYDDGGYAIQRDSKYFRQNFMKLHKLP